MANLETRPGSIEGHTVGMAAEKVNAHQAPALNVPLHFLHYFSFYCSSLEDDWFSP